ncbi:MAG: rRNA (cytidine-2'-O-)-methyltransferase, partial [Methylophilales bacterium 39-45-7]
PASGAARRKQLEALKTQTVTLVFYEAPHRILECVADLTQVLGAERRITFAREVTKTFETFYTCPLAEAEAWLKADTNQQRGEFVLLVEAPALKVADAIPEDAVRTLKLLLADLPLKQAVKLATDITQLKKNDLYEFALQLKDESKHDE